MEPHVEMTEDGIVLKDGEARKEEEDEAARAAEENDARVAEE